MYSKEALWMAGPYFSPVDNKQTEHYFGLAHCEMQPTNSKPSRGLFAKQDELKRQKKQNRQKWLRRLFLAFYITPTPARRAAE
jgi:hypothetical protein